jgi:cytoskeletal protein RodZ
MSVGEELRRARERAGLSTQDIADRTGVELYRIEAFEAGDFGKLPHGVYVLGVVRAYANELGIDATPLIDRVRQERAIGTTQVLPASRNLDDFQTESTRTAGAVTLERSRNPIPPVRPAAITALGVAAVLVASGLGGYLGGALYQTTRERPQASQSTTVHTTSDSARENANAEPAPVAREGAKPMTGDPGSAVGNLSGAWRLATHVESASYSRFNDLHLAYELQLKQAGERVTGVGTKVSENGRPLRARARTPITVAGVVDGDQLTLNFTERGTRRRSQGQFALMVDDPDTLRGRFASDAGQSSGTVEAKRLDR